MKDVKIVKELGTITSCIQRKSPDSVANYSAKPCSNDYVNFESVVKVPKDFDPKLDCPIGKLAEFTFIPEHSCWNASCNIKESGVNIFNCSASDILG